MNTGAVVNRKEAPVTAPNLPTGSLVIRAYEGRPFFEAKWRVGSRQVKRRIGPAWLVADPDGRWVKKRGRAADGYFTEKTATVRMTDLIREHAEEQGIHRSVRTATFGEAADAWLEYLGKADRAKPSTLQDYRLMLARPQEAKKVGKGKKKARIMKAFGDLPLRSIIPVDVERFLSKLDDEGMSTRLVNKHRAVLHAVFEYCRRPGTYGLSANPVSATEKRRERTQQRIEYFTPEELQAIVRAAENGRHRVRPDEKYGETTLAEWERFNRQDAALFLLAAESGLRLGELRALQWRDISFEDERITVTRAVSANQIETPKSGKTRSVPLARGSAQRLATLSQRERFTGNKDLVFCGYRGELLDGSAISRRFRDCQEKSGIPYRSFHKLRHTFCSQLVARGADLVKVKEWAGHSSITTTARYLHFKPQQDDAQFITDAFTPSTPSDGSRGHSQTA